MNISTNIKYICNGSPIDADLNRLYYLLTMSFKPNMSYPSYSLIYLIFIKNQFNRNKRPLILINITV